MIKKDKDSVYGNAMTKLIKSHTTNRTVDKIGYLNSGMRRAEDATRVIQVNKDKLAALKRTMR